MAMPKPSVAEFYSVRGRQKLPWWLDTLCKRHCPSSLSAAGAFLRGLETWLPLQMQFSESCGLPERFICFRVQAQGLPARNASDVSRRGNPLCSNQRTNTK